MMPKKNLPNLVIKEDSTDRMSIKRPKKKQKKMFITTIIKLKKAGIGADYKKKSAIFV